MNIPQPKDSKLSIINPMEITKMKTYNKLLNSIYKNCDYDLDGHVLERYISKLSKQHDQVNNKLALSSNWFEDENQSPPQSYLYTYYYDKTVDNPKNHQLNVYKFRSVNNQNPIKNEANITALYRNNLREELYSKVNVNPTFYNNDIAKKLNKYTSLVLNVKSISKNNKTMSKY